MAMNLDLTRRGPAMHAAPAPDTFIQAAVAAFLFAVLAGLASSALFAVSARRDGSVFAQCDQASITAAATVAAVPSGTDPDAARRRERQRSFHACLDEAAARAIAAGR